MKIYYVLDINRIYEEEEGKLPLEFFSSKRAAYNHILKVMRDAGTPEYYIEACKVSTQNGTMEEHLKEMGLILVEQEVIEN